MSLPSEEEAMQNLYIQLSGTEYKPSAHWTTVRTFTPTYQKVQSKFVLDDQLVPLQGIEPRLPRS
jgi:hypothetical protein